MSRFEYRPLTIATTWPSSKAERPGRNLRGVLLAGEHELVQGLARPHKSSRPRAL